MTLTTERQQFEQWWEATMHNGYPPRFGWEHWRDGDGYRDDDGEFQGLWQAWRASRNLANREAQPVLYASEETLAYAKEGEKSLVTWSEPMGDAVIPLFTAPPAPAKANQVAWEMRYWNSGHNMWGEWERITAEQHAEMSVQHAADNDYEFRVLYDVPQASQSTNVSDWGINMQTGTPILTYKNCCVIESEQAHYVLSLINSSAAPEGGN
ncbi:Uncharacterised protein [Serratia entomophila]|uniref:hypothetical protein n=1 Tax=Serratia entomophila TaxID=42906 RepID=UPI00217AF160|nr:hypothetical protein [Serratia entomophila]CAI0805596.1 Uncharacterised protein [Serratia entomophila]